MKPLPSPRPGAPADHWLAVARPLISARRYAEAIPAMRQAVAARPNNAPILCDLGRLFIDAGQPAQAIAPLRHAVALDPRLANAFLLLGFALEMVRDNAGATTALEQAVRLRPSLTDAHFRLGILYEDQRRFGLASASFRRAAQTTSLPSARLIAEARAMITESREQDAVPLLREALKQKPDNAVALGLLGGLLASLGRFAEAAECYDRALILSPLTAGAHYDLVRVGGSVRQTTRC